MKRLPLALLIALIPGVGWTPEALSQGTILQSGAWSAGHFPVYTSTGGSQPTAVDSGPASGGAAGVGIKELGITLRGTGSAPWADIGTGPLSTNFCNYDAPTTNATGGHYLCMSPNAQGGGLIAYGTFGTATPLPFKFALNGTTYEFPFVTGGIVGPGSTTVGHIATWANSSGTLLADGGALAPVAASGSSADVSFLQAGTGAVATTVQAKLRQTVNAADFGALCNGVANDTVAIQAAETYAASIAGQLIFPVGTCMATVLTKQSNSVWTGQGPGQTILKQIAATDLDFIIGPDNANFGTNNPAGITNFTIEKMTIDGNSSVQSLGTCVALYAYFFQMRELNIQNCKEHGLRTEAATNFPTISMESFYDNITISYTGKHGRWDNGPHDSITRNMIVYSASLTANNVYDGFFLDAQTSGQLTNVHYYGPGDLPGVNNNARYAINDSSFGFRVTNSFFEQGYTAILNAAAGGVSAFDPTNVFTNSGGAATVIIRQPVILNGFINHNFPGSFSVKGIVFAAGNPSNSKINVKMFNQLSGGIDYANSTGFHNINIDGFTSSGPGYVGTPGQSDCTYIYIAGATSNRSLVNQCFADVLGGTATNTTLLGRTYTFTAPNSPAVTDLAYRISAGTDQTTSSICRTVSLDGTNAYLDSAICHNMNTGNIGVGSLANASISTFKFGVSGTMGATSVTATEHFYNTSSAPTLSSCGTSPSVTAGSTNSGGQFTTGTGSPTACTVTFANIYPTTAFCTITPANAAAFGITAWMSGVFRDVFTITLSAGTNNAAYNYTCSGN